MGKFTERTKGCTGSPTALVTPKPPSFSQPLSILVRGHSMRFLVPCCRIDAYRCSFFPSGIRLWNQLLEPIVTAPALEIFTFSQQWNVLSVFNHFNRAQTLLVNNYSVTMLQREPCTYWKKKKVKITNIMYPFTRNGDSSPTRFLETVPRQI